MNSKETVAEWVDRIRGRSRASSPSRATTPPCWSTTWDWTQSLSTVDFLRDIGKHFRSTDARPRRRREPAGVGHQLHRVQLRAAAGDGLPRAAPPPRLRPADRRQRPVGQHHRRRRAVRRADGDRVHALATPLITKADGTKFGKTESGTIWLDPALMSPYAFYQSWIQAEDVKVGEYLKHSPSCRSTRSTGVMAEHAERPGAPAAQRLLASELTTLVHGEDETRAAELASQALFGRGDLDELPASTLEAALREAGESISTRRPPSSTPWWPRPGRQQVRRPPRGRRGRCVRQQRARRGPRAEPRRARRRRLRLGGPAQGQALGLRRPPAVGIQGPPAPGGPWNAVVSGCGHGHRHPGLTCLETRV